MLSLCKTFVVRGISIDNVALTSVLYTLVMFVNFLNICRHLREKGATP